MYDLPKGFSFEFIKHRELELVCFGPYAVTLHFSGDVRVQIEGPFRHLTAEHPAEPAHFPLSESKLMRLLSERVTGAKAKPNGMLSLTFSNGDAVVIDGNIGPYESYHISRPDAALLVV
ncbi:MAG TPA: DUF6188 family protein [Stellaceae bacterium]